MQLKPRHFHLGAAVLLFVACVVLAAADSMPGAGFTAVGGLVALLHWKAAKAGLLE